MRKEELIELISSTLGCDSKEINMQTGLLNHYLWESLAHVEIIVALENKYNIEIPDDLIAELNTVEKIYNYIKSILIL